LITGDIGIVTLVTVECHDQGTIVNQFLVWVSILLMEVPDLLDLSMKRKAARTDAQLGADECWEHAIQTFDPTLE